MVWERARQEAKLRAVALGRLDAGGAAGVHSADMRLQVLLSFAPDGCEYGEAEPVLLSDGCSRNAPGVAGGAPLPDGFRCTYSQAATSFAPLRISLLRGLDASSGAPAPAARGRSSGVGGAALSEAVAAGAPLLVRLSVPLWLLNATALPAQAGLLLTEPPPGAPPASAVASALGPESSGYAGKTVRVDISEPGAAQVRATRGLGSALCARCWQPLALRGALPFCFTVTCGVGGLCGVRPPQLNPSVLRVVDTEAFRSSPRPASSVQVQPRSLQLLSYPPGAQQDWLPTALLSSVAGPAGLGAAEGEAGDTLQVTQARPPPCEGPHTTCREREGKAWCVWHADACCARPAAVPQVALVLAMHGSRWTQPIHLPRPGEAPSVRRGPGGSLLPGDRLLIRALGRDDRVHEVALRIEVAPAAELAWPGSEWGGWGLGSHRPAATLLRLEHHLLLSNSSGYPLQLLLQPEPLEGSAAGGRQGG